MTFGIMSSRQQDNLIIIDMIAPTSIEILVNFVKKPCHLTLVSIEILVSLIKKTMPLGNYVKKKYHFLVT